MPPIRNIRASADRFSPVKQRYDNPVKQRTRELQADRVGAPGSRRIVILDCGTLLLTRVLLKRGWRHITVVENNPTTHAEQQLASHDLMRKYASVITLVHGELYNHLEEESYDAAIMDFLVTYNWMVAACMLAFSVRASVGATLEVVLSSRSRRGMKVDETVDRMAQDLAGHLDATINDVYSYRSWNPVKQAYAGSAGMVCYSYILGESSEKPVEYRLFRWDKQRSVVDTLLWNGNRYV